MKTDYNILFKKIFDQHYSYCVNIAIIYCNDRDIAEDFSQEIFLKLWEKKEEINKIKNLKAYIANSIKNKCLNYLNHLKVVDKYRLEYLNYLKDDEVDIVNDFKHINDVIDKLSYRRKQILIMSVEKSMSYEEIALQLDISKNTVKDHIKKAYSFIRKNINKKLLIFYMIFIKR